MDKKESMEIKKSSKTFFISLYEKVFIEKKKEKGGKSKKFFLYI